MNTYDQHKNDDFDGIGWYPPNSSSRTEGSERRTVYEGELHKCPNCGEPLCSFAAYCPACGYEIRNSANSQAVEAFVQKLEQSDSESKTVSLIKSFPIPNTREDVLEFLIYASANISDIASVPINLAWRVKFEQSYQKAQMLLQGADLNTARTLYKTTTQKMREQDVALGRKATGDALKKTGSVIAAIVRTIMRSFLAAGAVLAFYKAIQVDNLGANAVGYELVGSVLLLTSAAFLLMKSTTYIDLVLVACAGIQTFYWAGSLKNGALLLMTGFLALLFAFIGFVIRIVRDNQKLKSKKGE